MKRWGAYLILGVFAAVIVLVYPILKGLDWAMVTLHDEEPVVGSLRDELRKMLQ